MNENSRSKTLLKAYDQGFQDFYGRDFIVNPNVLIPRPETEQIIDAVLSLAGKPYLPGVKPAPKVLPKKPIILDVGTGSGCIAITLKLELSEAEVYGVDISKEAIKVAQKNALQFGVDPHTFIISDLLENVKYTPNVIVANLPYVNKDWDWIDQKSLSYEPELALYATDDGLAIIKKLCDASYRRKVCYLILEADPSQHNSIIKYLDNKYNLIDKRGFILSFELVKY